MLKDFQPGYSRPHPPPVLSPEDDGKLHPNGRGGFTYTLPKLVPDERPTPRPESPYELVGGWSSGGVNYMGRPRWEVERDRQKAEMELENQRLQMEYQRWMIEQMKNNPSGMNIRDLLNRMK